MYNAEATHAHSDDGAERHRKSRRLTLKGEDAEPPSNEVKTEDTIRTRAIAKRNQAERKRIKKLARQQKKRARIELKRASLLNTQYDSITSQLPPMVPPVGAMPPGTDDMPEIGGGMGGMGGMMPPPMMESGQYGPPDFMGPPPPPPPPPPDEYGPPPPLMMGPPPPTKRPYDWSNNISNHKQYGWNGRGSKASKALLPPPIEPPHIQPPHHPPFPPHHPYPPHKPTFFPTYLTSYPTVEQPTPGNERKTVRITIQGLMNSYGIAFPTSRDEYDALVRTLQQTIYDTARASLYINQKVIGVKIVQIEGITPEESEFRRHLQSSVNGKNNVEEIGSLQCTFQERQQCCDRNLPVGQENPVQYCQSLGCNFKTCRRIRFDIVAEQLLEQGSNRKLQSVTDTSTQNVVDNLYNTITSYMTAQVEGGEFTISLRENAKYCGEVCLATLADASILGVVFAPATDILVAIPTPAPTKFPTRSPLPPPPTYQPTDGEPTYEPTYYPTQSPTLFVSSSCFNGISRV